MFKIVNGVQVPLTEVEIAQRQLDAAKHDEQMAAEVANEYKRKRIEAFPSIGEQLDMIYWDQINGTTVWRDLVANIKAQYPKPE